jgi:hypothetical protein
LLKTTKTTTNNNQQQPTTTNNNQQQKQQQQQQQQKKKTTTTTTSSMRHLVSVCRGNQTVMMSGLPTNVFWKLMPVCQSEYFLQLASPENQCVAKMRMSGNRSSSFFSSEGRRKRSSTAIAW